MNQQLEQLLGRAKGTNHMNRNEWEFEYTAKNIALAAIAQRDFRLGRVKAWEEKKGEVMARIKESGLTVDEGVAAEMSAGNAFYNTTAVHQGAHVRVDEKLQSDLTECVQKIRQHRDSAKDYDGWVQVLEANPEARLKLRHADWMFFFGK